MMSDCISTHCAGVQKSKIDFMVYFSGKLSSDEPDWSSMASTVLR